jgi:aromatic ring-opening dioxygenase LigB subunit
LAFARNNYWTHLLLNKFKDNDYAANMRIELEPITLAKETLYCYIAIMNQSLDQQRLEMILEELLIYKNWQMD